jgi:hypothetical protein
MCVRDVCDVYLCRYVCMCVRVTHSTRGTKRLPMCLCQCVMWCACDVPMRVWCVRGVRVCVCVRDESMMM